MTEEEWRLDQEYSRTHAPDFLFDDAVRFIKNIGNCGFKPFIFTFGDRDFQAAKIESVPMDLPTIFLKYHDKTKQIKSWINNDAFQINGDKFHKVVLIDDCDHSFAGFENLPNARGYLLNRENYKRNIDRDRLPDNIKIIKNFDEINMQDLC